MGYGIGLVAFTSFIPVVGLITSTAYVAFGFGGPVAIPLYQGLKNGLSNRIHLKLGIPYKDKSKYNQQKHEIALQHKIEDLYKRVQNNELTLENFENEIANLKQETCVLSRSNNNQTIKVREGTANVNQNNANAAIKYKKEYGKTKKILEKLQKDLKKGEISSNDPRLLHYTAKMNALKNGEFSEQSIDAMNDNTHKYIEAVNGLEKTNKRREKKAIEKNGKFVYNV